MTPPNRGSVRSALVMVAVLLVVGMTGAFVMMQDGGPAVGASGDAALAKTADEATAPGEGSGNQDGTTEREESESVEMPADDAAGEAAPEEGIPPDATGLTGRIIGRDGKPAAGVEIRVERAVEREKAAEFGVVVDPGKRHARYARTAETDADGRFVLIDLVVATGYQIKAQTRSGLLGQKERVEVVEKLVFDIGDVPLRRGATVSGLVRTESGLGVEGAEVTIGWRWSDQPILTDTAGRFDADILFPGKHRVEVKARGYALPETLEREFIEGDEVDDLELVLVPASPLAGRVVDEAGRGVADVQVNANRRNERAFGWYSDDQVTGSDGRFSFDSIPAGTYDVSVWASGYQPVQMEAVESGGSPIDIILKRSGMISGIVLDARDGAPIEPEEVQLTYLPPWMKDNPEAEFRPYRNNVDTDLHPDGTFKIRLTGGGTFKVEASAEGYAPSRSVAFELKENGSISGILVQMNPGIGLEVKVVDAVTREPVAGAVVDIHRGREQKSGARVQGLTQLSYLGGGMNMLSGTHGLGQRLERLTTDTEGVARCGSISVGRLALVAEKRGYAPARVEGLEVRHGVPPSPVEIPLSLGGAIEGKVINNRGQSEPALDVVAAGPNGERGETVSLENGRYRVENLTPGRYRVEAQLEGDKDELQRMLFRGRRGNEREIPEAERFPVVVEEGRTVEHDVTVERIDPGSIAGTVLINGTPTANIQVLAGLADDGGGFGWFGWGNNVKTDEFGNFRFRRLSPGAYELTVMRDWSAAFKGGRFEVTSNQETQATIEIGVGAITGRVVDEARQPLAGVNLRAIEQRDGRAGRSPWGGSQSAQSGADGTFMVEDLQAGTFSLSVKLRGFVTQSLKDLGVAAHRSTGPLDIVMARGGWLKIRVNGFQQADDWSSRLDLRFEGTGGQRKQDRWAQPDDSGLYWLEIGGEAKGRLTVTSRGFRGEAPRTAATDVVLDQGANAEATVTLP